MVLEIPSFSALLGDGLGPRERLPAGLGQGQLVPAAVLPGASAVRLAVEDPATPDARWCFEQHVSELDARFDAGFDPSRSVSTDGGEMMPPDGLLLVSHLRDRPVGCGAIKYGGAGDVRARETATRGVRAVRPGNGRRGPPARDERFLEREAIELYRRSGYCEIAPSSDEPNADLGFEKRSPSR